eukprot:2473969-Rhodomonas_salina.1
MSPALSLSLFPSHRSACALPRTFSAHSSPSPPAILSVKRPLTWPLRLLPYPPTNTLCTDACTAGTDALYRSYSRVYCVPLYSAQYTCASPLLCRSRLLSTNAPASTDGW